MTLKTMTLKEACDAYVTYMRESGQKPSTLGTIQRTLTLLVEVMGESKEVGKILPVHVDKFYKSEKATMQPGRRAAAGNVSSVNGDARIAEGETMRRATPAQVLRPRAEASVLQIRRIVRMALVWWKEQGYMERLAVPGSERVFIDKAEKRAAERAEMEAKLKKTRKAKVDVTSEVTESSEYRDDSSRNNSAHEEM